MATNWLKAYKTKLLWIGLRITEWQQSISTKSGVENVITTHLCSRSEWISVISHRTSASPVFACRALISCDGLWQSSLLSLSWPCITTICSLAASLMVTVPQLVLSLAYITLCQICSVRIWTGSFLLSMSIQCHRPPSFAACRPMHQVLGRPLYTSHSQPWE